MVGTSKILTVSYGTFSCTLEGFDDSFNTMKAIAEYFRDLAADDRYFGAEPPTPDAEMLARIAEREISRRVEARSGADGVVLRPALSQPDPAPEPPEMPETQPQGDTSAAAISAAVSAVASARSSSNQPETEPAAPDRAEDAAEDELSDQLTPEHREGTQEAQRDRLAEADADDDTTTATTENAVDEGIDPAPLADATPEAATEPEQEPEDSALLSKADQVDEALVDEAQADADRADASQAEEDQAEAAPTDTDDGTPQQQAEIAPSTPAMPEPLPEAPAHPDADSVAAKLQRIRAVVGQGNAQTTASDYTEDMGGDDLSAGGMPDVTDYSSTPAEAEEHADEAKFDTAEDTTETEAEEIAPTADAPAVLEVEAAVPEVEPAAPEVEPAAPEAELAEPVDTDEPEAPVEASETVEDAAEATEADSDTGETAAEDTVPQDAAERDAEFVGEITEPDLATLDGADDLDEYLGNRGQADLSPEEEAELMEAVAEEPAATDTDDDAAVSAEPRKGFETTPEEDEASLNRLLDETDAQMKEPEGNRRRAAIAHLKAAVAATQADDGDTTEAEDNVENAFRDDLDKVVRPRRAPKADHHSERPRPAPLKLVAAQRVDVAEDEGPAKPVQPVRPRRVQARARAEGNAPDGFAEFAEQMEARELPELLEAAAAYTSFVEGAEEFSRPQIMRRVRQLTPDSFNREDGLRSFADLLREGRINKVRNGRFQVSEDTRFNPQRQAS
ncbi:MAG: hypothetical protein GVY31_07395 [Alphaproteobacteria bacterium]|jgi:hypothetical protein|nr:hypothetical protein [Alphaproteobacteria bacterium]